MKNAAFLTTFYLSIVALFPVQTNAQSPDETAIRSVLYKQVKAWNSGSIDVFMQGYWNSDSLMFIGKNGPQYGYTSTLENYRKRYPNSASMGKLSFDQLKLKWLSAEYYFVIGRWNLKRTTGNLGGYFTLLLKKIKNNWLIICDHTS